MKFRFDYMLGVSWKIVAIQKVDLSVLGPLIEIWQ